MKSSGKTAPKRATSNESELPAKQERRRTIAHLPLKVAALMLVGAASGCAPSFQPPAQVPSKPPALSAQAAASSQSSTVQSELASRALADAQAEFNTNAAYIQENFVPTIENKMKAFDPNFSFSSYAQQFNEQLSVLLFRSNVILVFEPGSPFAGSVSDGGIIQLNVAKDSLSTPLHEALDYISKNCQSRYLAEAGSELLTQLFLSRDQKLLNENPPAAYPLQTFALYILLESKIVTPDAFFKAYMGNATEFNAQINAFTPGLAEKLFPPITSLDEFLNRDDVRYTQNLRIFFSDPRTKDIADDILARAAVLNIRLPENMSGR